MFRFVPLLVGLREQHHSLYQEKLSELAQQYRSFGLETSEPVVRPTNRSKSRLMVCCPVVPSEELLPLEERIKIELVKLLSEPPGDVALRFGGPTSRKEVLL